MELRHATLLRLSDVIRELCGLSLGSDKAYLVRHRLAPLVQRERLASFEQLLERLQGPGATRLHDAIIEAITTKETSFFRDHSLFAALRANVLPERVAMLRGSRGQRQRIRIWSAGCATGQEPYSVAMLIRDLPTPGPDAAPGDTAFTILATDLSAEALDFAKTGCYDENHVNRGLSVELLERHFTRHGRCWLVKEPLRRLVQFRRFDLLHPPAALGAFDLILCRNVLIYFDETTRERVLRGLCGALHPGGWIALGAAESLYGSRYRLERVNAGRAMLYRKPVA